MKLHLPNKLNIEMAAGHHLVLYNSRFDLSEFIYQLEQLGVRSLAIAAATAIFVGIVMTIQFAVSMEAFGAKETLGRVVAVSEARELAAALALGLVLNEWDLLTLGVVMAGIVALSLIKRLVLPMLLDLI